MILAMGIAGAVWVVKLIHEEVEMCACVRRGDVPMPNGVRTVHVMDDTAIDSLAEFRRINVHGTLDLARQAAAAGVLRFVFISSIKVNGEATKLEMPFSADDIPAPLDPYKVSRIEAEQGLREIAAQTGMKVGIIGPPLVYIPGVKVNFAAHMRAVQHGWSLPLNPLHKTTELVLGLARAARVPERLVTVAVWVLRAGSPCWAKATRCSDCAAICRWIFPGRTAYWAGCLPFWRKRACVVR